MTAQTLINSSLRVLGVLRSGGSPTAQQSADALEALNEILASWSAQQVPCLGLVEDTHTLTGAAEYTIGSGATIDTDRPLRVKAARVVNDGLEVPLKIVPAEVWADGTISQVLFYDGAYPTGTVKIRPALSGGELQLQSYKALTAVATLATVIALPPGYERALKYALAIDLGPEYGRSIPPEAAAAAKEATSSIGSLNSQVLGEGVAPAA